MVVSNVLGEDPSFFAAVAVPSNLLWLGGFIALGVAAQALGPRPRGGHDRPAGHVVLTLPLSVGGGGIAAGAYWFAVGWMLRDERLERRPAAAVATA